MTVLANRRLYQDILPYTRREPQYDRVRAAMRRPAQIKQTELQTQPVMRNIDGIHTGKSRTIPVVQPKMLASAKESEVTVRRTGRMQTRRHMDMVVRPRRMAYAPVTVPAQQPAIAQQFEQADQQDTADLPEHSLSRKLMQILPVGVAVVMLLAGTAVFAWTVKTNKQVVAQVQASAADTAGEDEQPPAEDEVSAAAVGNHRVAPDAPRTLTIDKIDVFSRIQRLGTLRSGALAAPANVHDTGWYEGSSKPGDGGAMLLVGHVYGPSKPGVFKNLHKLEAGDVVTVARGDGQEFNYKVIKKEQVAADQVDMAAALVPVTPGKAGLNIITCAGELIPGTTHYADRIVVFAEQI